MDPQLNSVNTAEAENLKDFHLKRIDIFPNLKLSMKNIEKNCQCDNRKAYYCFPCKCSICDQCGYTEHSKHILLNKSDYILSKEYLDSVFTVLTNEFSKGEVFKNSQALHSLLLKNIEEMAATLHQKVDDIKEAKAQEVNKMFSNFDLSLASLKTNLDISYKTIQRYIDLTMPFYNIKNDSKPDPDYNNDDMNTVFLLNLDIIKLCNEEKEAIVKLVSDLNEDVEAFKYRQGSIIQNFMETTDQWLMDAVSDLKYPYTSRLMSLPWQNFEVDSLKLNDGFFQDIRLRINKYDAFIASFKKNVYETFKQNGYREIEKFVAKAENNTKGKVNDHDGLFSQRKQDVYTSFSKSARGYQYPKYNSPDNVILNNALIEKYFAYQIVDVYKKNFKVKEIELQSSHADLLVKPNFTTGTDDKDTPDIGRAIEGTNEIVFYDKKNGTITKKYLKLTKNPFSYTLFPIGCRSCLLGDKIFITGGQDPEKEYGTVVIYDRKTDTLKRIMDLKYPRSYHTMVFSDFFDTLIVLGGQNCNKVEIFDPLTNRWHELPSLQVPRANSLFYLDKPRGYLYSFFGIVGNIIKRNYTETMEYLDLANIKQGWKKLNYKNKAEVNVRTYLNAFPIAGEKILFVGSFTYRSSERIMVVFDLIRKEIRKVDQKLIEQLRTDISLSRKISRFFANNP